MYEDEISRIFFADPDMVRYLLALLPPDAVAGLDTCARDSPVAFTKYALSSGSRLVGQDGGLPMRGGCAMLQRKTAG